eukprot:614846-Hanusia_phi.AAC.1
MALELANKYDSRGDGWATVVLYLRHVFNVKSNSASELQVLGCFSEANPIDNLVQTARKNSTVPHACVCCRLLCTQPRNLAVLPIRI